MFYYRKAELAKMMAVYQDPRPQAIAIYGRRRTGKSELIQESFRQTPNIRHFYYLCGSDTYLGNLLGFANELAAYLGVASSLLPTFSSFRQVFVYFRPYFATSKMLIAIDEFPYLTKKKNGAEVAHEFQAIIEQDLAPTQVSLILCGSEVRYMKEVCESYDSPLYGRFREILVVNPFTYSEVAPLFPKFTPFEILATYAATGGVAAYVFYFKDYPTFQAAIVALFLSPSARLLDEPQAILAAEFTAPAVYGALLKRLAPKPAPMSSLVSAIGLPLSSLYPYLEKLKAMGLVQEYATAFSEKQRDVFYYISDPFFRFAYGFIDPHRSQIGLCDSSLLFNDIFNEEALHTFLGHIYEDAIVKRLLMELGLAHRLPFLPRIILPWRGQVKNGKGEVGESEIDVVAYDATHIIFGECKAKKQPLGLATYRELLAKIPFVPSGRRQPQILLASFSGFTPEVLALANQGVLLVAGTTLLNAH
jgi:uncharacterized protein